MSFPLTRARFNSSIGSLNGARITFRGREITASGCTKGKAGKESNSK